MASNAHSLSSLRASGPIHSRLHSPSPGSPVTHTAFSVPFSSQPLPPLPPALPRGGCFVERYLPSAQNQTQGGLLSPGCAVAWPLSFDNAGHTTEETQIKGWRPEGTASRVESWGSTQGNRIGFPFSSRTHTTIKARKDINTPKPEMPATYDDIHR